MSDMTLYGIESTLMRLMEVRDSIADDPELSDETRSEALTAVDESLADALKSELRKVDGVAWTLAEFDARAESCRIEAGRLAERKRMWENRAARLRESVIAAMQMMGKDHIEGTARALKLRKCPASVEIMTPDLVPSDYCIAKLELVEMGMELMLTKLSKVDPETATALSLMYTSEPSKRLIKGALKEGKDVPGAVMDTTKKTLVVG